MKNKRFKNYKKFYIVAPLCHGNGGWYGEKVLAEFNTLKECFSYKDERAKFERSWDGTDSLRICIDKNPNHAIFVFNDDKQKWEEEEDFFTELANSIALISHQDQRRRGGEDYWYHVDRVAGKMETSEEKQVAYLHDVLEDTKTTLKDLKEYGFSDEVLDAVIILTKREHQEYSDYLKDIKQNKLAKSVKIADMLDNISDKPTKKQVLKYAKGLVFLLED